MNNSFTLELDTTPPELKILLPNYAIKGKKVEIYIYSNEMLGQYQDIYFVDSDGEKHDVIFNIQNDEVTGEVDFSNFASGIAKFYVRLKDEVLNKTSLIEETTLVLVGAEVKVTLKTNVRTSELIKNRRKIELVGKTRRQVINYK